MPREDKSSSSDDQEALETEPRFAYDKSQNVFMVPSTRYLPVDHESTFVHVLLHGRGHVAQ